MARSKTRRAARPQLPKARTGIQGFDEITSGGLPRGRPTLVCGGAGCGKTLFAMEFLVRGAAEFGEPGVFMAFEETAGELAANVASLGFDLEKLQAQKKLFVDYVRVERAEIEETGEYDLEGLFVRLQSAIEAVGARRVVLDTVESLFSALPNPLVLRSELRRLFGWLKARGMTVVLTGEKGEGTLTRQGLEEYVSDCVVVLDHRVTEQTSTRRLRVVKYRGSVHGTNEYPFLIDENGISVLPVSSLGLAHQASTQRVSSGIPRLDEMLGGKGYFKGSTILLSGTAGTGKTTVASLLARAACQRGERCLSFLFEESTSQLVRNMHSVGVHLEPFLRSGLLRTVASRPTAYGLERHLVEMHKAVADFRPSLVILDPVTNLDAVGTSPETRSMLVRLIDYLKLNGITTCFTSLTGDGAAPEQSEVGISSLIDTWLVLQVVRSGGERNRTLTIIKSRGMAHSNQSVEYLLGPGGVELVDTYVGSGGVLTGSARVAQEAEDRARAVAEVEEVALRHEQSERRRRILLGQIEALREELAGEETAVQRTAREAGGRQERLRAGQKAMALSRQAFADPGRAGRAGRKAGRR